MVMAAGGGLLEGWGGMVRLAALSRGMVILSARTALCLLAVKRSQCPTPLRAGLLSPRVVPPHPQGLQGSHLNLSQASA